MTTINTVLVSLFTANSKPTDTSHRLVTFRWKSMKGKKALSPDLCTSIPNETISCNPSFLSELATDAFHDMQKEIMLSTIEQQLEAGISPANLSPIDLDTISKASVATYFSARAAGDRLTKALVEAWFDTELNDTLFLAFANKKGFNETNTPNETEEALLNKACNNVKQLLLAFSAPKLPNYNEVVTSQLTKMVALISDTSTSTVTKKIQSKLHQLSTAKEITIEELL